MLPPHVLDRIRAINDADSPLTPEQQRVLKRAFATRETTRTQATSKAA